MTRPAQPSATRGYFKGVAAFMWMALPIVAFRYWQFWDQLPPRMITHFGTGGRPNGWMSREGALTFSLGLLFFVLILFTAILLYALRRMRQPDSSMWAIVGLFYAIT